MINENFRVAFMHNYYIHDDMILNMHVNKSNLHPVDSLIRNSANVEINILKVGVK